MQSRLLKRCIKLSLECYLLIHVSNALVFFKLSFSLTKDHVSPKVFSHFNHVCIKFKFAFCIMRKVGRNWLETWLWFLLVATKNQFWASAKCSQLCCEWNWEWWKLRNRWMAFQSVLVIAGVISCANTLIFGVFSPCLPCRQCSSRSQEQAQGEGGEGAQGENHGAERDRGKWSRVCKPGERSGQANYAISGQRVKNKPKEPICFCNLFH